MEDAVPSPSSKKGQMMIGALVLIAVLAAAWWFFVYRKKKSTGGGDSAKSNEEKPPTIYGSLGCPYTVKQMEKYPGHTFVDCTSEKCPDFVTAYPTTKFSDGRVEVGFS